MMACTAFKFFSATSDLLIEWQSSSFANLIPQRLAEEHVDPFKFKSSLNPTSSIRQIWTLSFFHPFKTFNSPNPPSPRPHITFVWECVSVFGPNTLERSPCLPLLVWLPHFHAPDWVKLNCPSCYYHTLRHASPYHHTRHVQLFILGCVQRYKCIASSSSWRQWHFYLLNVRYYSGFHELIYKRTVFVVSAGECMLLTAKWASEGH